MFTNINNFRSNLVITNPTNSNVYPQVLNHRGIDIHLYSLTIGQRMLGITLIVLSLLVLIIGLIKVPGVNLTGLKAMIGSGAAVPIATILAMTTNYLVFKKKVDTLLAVEWNNGQPGNHWTNCTNYPEDQGKHSIIGGDCHMIKTFTLPCALMTFSAEFFRTEDIYREHTQRMTVIEN